MGGGGSTPANNKSNSINYQELYYDNDRELKDLQTKYKSISQQLSTCQSATTDSSQANLNSLKQQINSLNKRVEEYQKKETNYKKQIDSLKVNEGCADKKKQLENDYLKLQKDYTQLRDHGCDEIKNNLDKLNIELSQMRIRLNDEIAGKTNNDSRLASQLEDNRKLIEENNNLTIKINQLQTEASNNSTTYEQTIDENNNLKAQLQAKEDLINTSQTRWHDVMDPIIDNYSVLVNAQNTLQFWLEKFYDITYDYYNSTSRDITTTQTSVRNILDDFKKQIDEIKSYVDSGDGKITQEFDKLIENMKLVSTFKIEQLALTKKLLKQMREVLKGKLNKATGELKKIDITKESYDSVYKQHDQHTITTDVISIMLLLVIVCLVYMFRYEIWAMISGKERFVNMFGGDCLVISYR